MKADLEKFYALVDEIEIAMMTTRRPDGHLESRAMATQKRAAGADLWFVTAEGTGKLRDLEADPHVNLSYYKDRQKIRELYATDWKMWFPEEGDSRHGTPEDPRFVLIGVDIHAAVFLEVNKPQPVVLFEMAKGWLTGQAPDVGETHRIER
jgi:general stress protein 26